MRKIEFSLSKTLLSLILATACAAATASDTPAPFDATAVLEQQKQIRGDIDAGRGNYGKLNAATRQELRSRQDRLSKLLDGHRYEDLSAGDREQAHQDLSWIQSAGADKVEDRVTCERVRAIGSNRVERVCKSASQRRDEQKNRVDPKLDTPGVRN
ncbi:hypothetical protein [Lysobacter gummosus]|jgi:Skp family chaperone for outer membrane proteins|uniref:hypothetical protein n=1 Tax=Lysobacter gummosus TaxID=262324 RepID=UPI0007168960|nr:hypothetical protein LG3211_4312 [Lysobacter gummosus]